MSAGSRQIVVLGGGFAGLWSAVGAARKLDEVGIGSDTVDVTLVNRDAYHGIRVRNYEPDLREVRVPLADVLDPIGVRRVEGEVTGIDLAARAVTVCERSSPRTLPYDRLVFALGSELARPALPGLSEHAFDVDTYGGALRLAAHLQALGGRPASPARDTVLVVGAGLTGIEAATEMPARLRAVLCVAGVFAAGDAAGAMMDDTHASVMSCQHGRPMGRFAGHNVVCDLLGQPMLPLRIDWYVTVLDLGPWGAVYTEGWNRRVAAQGRRPRRRNRKINCRGIYPPRSRDRREILAAAAPIVHTAPTQYHRLHGGPDMAPKPPALGAPRGTRDAPRYPHSL